MASLTCLLAGLLQPAAQAQTNMTIKPFQIRFEVPVGIATNLYLSNCNLRIPTNGASGLDGTGTNWIIPDVNATISGAPAGCTASLLNSDLATPVGPIPVNLNTGNTASNTNLVVNLNFDGSQKSGTSTIAIMASGAGLPDDNVLLTVEVAKIWNGSADVAANGPGSWSDSSQWLSAGSPQPGDNVVFTDVGTQTSGTVTTSTSTNILTNSVVDATTVISSLRFSQTNGSTNYHNLFINPGVTLALKGNDGFKMLRDYTYDNQKMFVTISGENGSFVQTNENSDFSILIDGASGSAAYGTLDMSQLGNLYLDVNQVQIGDAFAYPNYWNLNTNGYTSGSKLGSSLPNKMNDTWLMAQTNFVKATYVDPDNYTNASDRNYSVMLGRNNISGGSSGKDAVISLGASNVFYIDSMCVAGYACLGGVVSFQNPNSYALFRNTDGHSRMTTFTTADAASTTYGSTSGAATKAGPIDFSGGYVDMLVDKFYLSRDRGVRDVSGGQSQTALDFGQGVIDANVAILGFQNEGTQPNGSYCYATMVVSNTAVFKVNDTLALGYTTADAGSANTAENGYGQLTIGPGGTVYANKITIGGVTKLSGKNSITLTGGGSLVVSNNIGDATPGGALGTLDMQGGSSLTLFVDGNNASGALVYVTNLTASGTGNTLIIGGVTNITSFPVDIPLIAGMGGPISPSAFDAGIQMPAGMTGVLSLSSSNTINVHILNRTPHHLVWRATGSTANWDYTSKNWLDTDTGLTTNYNNPDIASFDDTPGVATNIVISDTGALTPVSVNMTNNNLYYTFSDGGNTVLGGPELNKYGTGTVEVDGNTTFSVKLNQGSLVGSGSIGSAEVSAGSTMNYAGSIGGSVIDSGIATIGGTVAGTLTIQSGGMVTNNGVVNNPFEVQSGAFLYNTSLGALHNIGTGKVSSPQVAAGATLANAGIIGDANADEVLYVNGTFEDLGSSGMTLLSLGMGSGSTFIPGGESIGTTTINGDTLGTPNTFPGALLLSQGSQTIFKVNPSTPANTIVAADHLSFGGSSSQQTQNGATLVITNVSATPFAAGQSFQLFQNVFIPGSAPFNTGSSSNTFPNIIPSTPGPGLVWDLRHLWVPNDSGVSGVIGIVGANVGLPTLTNSFTFTGSNIVAQFSWDPTNQGMRLETLVTPPSVGLTPNTNYNWSGVAGSQTNLSVTLTNSITTNDVFYRLSFP